MGDSAEFEKLSDLETRLRAALDRISSGISAQAANGTGDASSLAIAEEGRLAAEGVCAELETQNSELMDRVQSLEARLAETQDALSEAQSEIASANAQPLVAPIPVADTAELDALRAKLTAAEAALAEKTEVLTVAHATLEEQARVAAAAPDETLMDELKQEIAVLERRVTRARAERDTARFHSDSAQDKIDEMVEKAGFEPEDRVVELRGEVRRLKEQAETMAAELAKATDVASMQTSDVEQALIEEAKTLREVRKSDAAELERILAALQTGINPDPDVVEVSTHA